MESSVAPQGTPATAASSSPALPPPESTDLPEVSASTQMMEGTTSAMLQEERKITQPPSSLQQTLPSSSSPASTLSSIPLVTSAPSSSAFPSLQSPAVNPISSKQPHAQSQSQPQPHPRPLQPPRPVRPSHFPLNVASPSSASSPSSSSSLSSSSSNLVPSSGPLQRSGMAIGVPASLQQQRAPQQSSVPFSSFGPSPPFSQSYSALPRSSANMLNQGPNANAQGRPPGQTVQNSGLGAQANSLRPGGFPGNYQPRPGQTSLRSPAPSTIQSSTNQKFQSGPFRGPSLSSPASPSPSQQPWLTSSSYRPPSRAPLIQSRPTQPPLPTSLIQQSNSSQQQGQKQQLQPPLPKVQQPIYLQQHIKSLKSTVQTSLQTGAPQSGSIHPSSSSSGMDADDRDDNEDDSCSTIISKKTIRDLVAQIDPSERLDPEVEDILVEVAEDFVESITTYGCSLAKHRKSSILEAKDILLHLERNWHMTIPGFGGDEIKNYKKLLTNDVHKERLALIRKSMAATSEAGNAKNATAGQSSMAHGKNHAPKPPPSLIGSPKLA